MSAPDRRGKKPDNEEGPKEGMFVVASLWVIVNFVVYSLTHPNGRSLIRRHIEDVFERLIQKLVKHYLHLNPQVYNSTSLCATPKSIVGSFGVAPTILFCFVFFSPHL